MILLESISVGDHLGRMADVALVVGPVAYFFLKWIKRIDSMFLVTKDVTKSHLPFIYRRLRAHDVALAIEPVEHPNIVLVANGSK